MTGISRLSMVFWGGLLLGSAIPAQAALYDGSWVATDSNIFAVDFAAGAKGSLFLYDIQGEGPGDRLDVFSKNASFANVYFTLDGGNVLHVSLTDGDTAAGTSVALAGSSFGFFFSGDGGTTPLLSYEMAELGTNLYQLANSSLRMQAMVHDVSPVPLPAAFWLLGSGLTAAIAVAKRKRRLPL